MGRQFEQNRHPLPPAPLALDPKSGFEFSAKGGFRLRPGLSRFHGIG